MSRITIRIPEKLRKELKQLCRRQQRPLSEFVRESLRRQLSHERLSEIRQKLRPYAQAKGFRIDEDVFKAIS